jgi:hypothetical protein
MQKERHRNHFQDDEALKRRYGKGAVIVRLGHINIVHLDHSSRETIHQRTEEIMREELTGEAFFDDCPLCREFQKHPYDIVYYKQD